MKKQEANGGQSSDSDSEVDGKKPARMKDSRTKQKMLKYMNEFYRKIKEDVGLIKNEHQVKEDTNLDKLVKHLRPNSTASNFRNFMTVKKQ